MTGKLDVPLEFATLAISALLGRDLSASHVGELQTALELAGYDPTLLARPIEISRDLVGISPLERSTALLLLMLLAITQRDGNTRLRLDSAAWLQVLLESLCVAETDTLMSHAVAEWIPRLQKPAGLPAKLLGDAGNSALLVRDDKSVQIRRLFECEKRVASKLALLACSPVEQVPFEEVSPSSLGIPLSDEQRIAAQSASKCRLTVITGGPGTGKTTIVAAILRQLAIDPSVREVALATPTGKAAQRLAESLDRQGADSRLFETNRKVLHPPRTLHRLLEYSRLTGQFRRSSSNPISADVVIVDESSMIDLPLMDVLLSSLAENTRLILLGDSDQLPSVDIGSVFRDLVEFADNSLSAPLPVYRLTKSHRMDEKDPAGKRILLFAKSLLDPSGSARPWEFLEPQTADDSPLFDAVLSFSGIEWVDTDRHEQMLERFLEDWFRRLILPGLEKFVGFDWRFVGGNANPTEEAMLDELFSHWSRSKLLCLTNVSWNGTERINDLMANKLKVSFTGKSQQGYLGVEPILMQSNDYEKGIFNGDIGVVLLILGENGKRTPMAVFRADDRYASFPIESLRGDVVMGLAMTVHKSQGSEYDHVALVMPTRDMPLNTRELLYTAVTRSRRSATIVGSRAVISSAIRRPIRRETGLQDRLREAYRTQPVP